MKLRNGKIIESNNYKKEHFQSDFINVFYSIKNKEVVQYYNSFQGNYSDFCDEYNRMNASFEPKQNANYITHAINGIKYLLEEIDDKESFIGKLNFLERLTKEMKKTIGLVICILSSVSLLNAQQVVVRQQSGTTKSTNRKYIERNVENYNAFKFNSFRQNLKWIKNKIIF